MLTLFRGCLSVISLLCSSVGLGLMLFGHCILLVPIALKNFTRVKRQEWVYCHQRTEYFWFFTMYINIFLVISSLLACVCCQSTISKTPTYMFWEYGSIGLVIKTILKSSSSREDNVSLEIKSKTGRVVRSWILMPRARVIGLIF